MFTLTREKFIYTGAWLSIFACFSLTVLGTAATTIALTAATVLWLLGVTYKQYLKTLNDYPFTAVSLALFVYLGITLLWTANTGEGLVYWKKYREFILLPVFLFYFSTPRTRQFAQIALFSGMLISLVISYLVFFDLFRSPPRIHSIENDIFNSIVLAFFAYWIMNLSVNANIKYRAFYLFLFLACLFAVFFIRHGRTGQILFFVLFLLFIVQQYGWKAALLAVFVTLPISYLLIVNIFPHPNATLEHSTRLALLDWDYLAQVDIRLEYYINTFRIIADHLFFGVGVGDFPDQYATVSASHSNYWGLTANPHCEFLMITAVSGIFGLALLGYFFYRLFEQATAFQSNQSRLAVATAITITVACLFNSSFLDNNDGTLFVLLIASFFQFSGELDTAMLFDSLVKPIASMRR